MSQPRSSPHVRRPTRRTWAHGFREHLEAIVVALVLALLLKQFCVEAFEIPTSSMHPTLVGENRSPQGVGDRICVDKLAYAWGDPERWDVAVFRFPLDASRHYVKRVVGLPGEHFFIGPEDGDIWIAKGEGEPLAIARKPRRVRETLYRPVFPDPTHAAEMEAEADRRARPEFADAGEPTLPGEELGERWFQEVGEEDAFDLSSLGRFVFRGGSGTLDARYPIQTSTRPVHWRGSYGGRTVRDVRLRFRFVPQTGETLPTDASQLVVSWQPDRQYEYRVALNQSDAGTELAVLVEGKVVRRVPLSLPLARDRATALEIEAVDGDLRLHWNGEEVAVVPDGRPFSRPTSSPGQRLRFEAQGAPFAIEGLAIDRDIAYESEWAERDIASEGLFVPAESYIVLGDNQGDVEPDPRGMSSGSYDSRKWEEYAIHLKDGTTIRYDRETKTSPVAHYDAATGETWKRTIDIHGMDRRWRATDEDPDVPIDRAHRPFVQRNLFVGRAFVVFWPLWPQFPGRAGWVH